MNAKLERFLTTANNILNYKHPTELPEVSLTMCTRRGYLVQDIVDKINAQTIPFKYVSIVAHDYTDEQLDVLTKGIKNGELKLTVLNDTTSLGERHNIAVRAIDGDDSHIVLVMDDDDLYFPNYAKQMVNTLLIFGAELASITDPILVTENKLRCGWLYPYLLEKPKSVGAGGTLTFTLGLWRKIPFADVATGYDSKFQVTCTMLWKKTASAPPFNFAVTRGMPDHVWVPNAQRDPRFVGLQYNDINLADVEL